ncbi:MAG: methyl-accepting chemotaxis protein [Deltaproteobacteria bacterium]|nr:methyl-accepting chemotaxis protein [Deltaproteobacteria bacterium]
MQMNLGKKLVGSFLILIFLLIVVGAISFISLGNVSRSADKINFSAEYDDAIMSTIISVVKMQGMMTDLSLTGSEEGMGVAGQKKDFHAKYERLLTMATSSEERQEIEALDRAYDVFFTVGIKMVEAYASGNQSDGNKLMISFDANVEILEEIMEGIEVLAEAIADENLASAKSAASKANTLIIIVSLLSVIIGLILSLTITRAITGPVRALAKGAKQMAEGDLRIVIKRTTSDEIGEMTDVFNDMTSKLRTMIKNINESFINLASATEQINSGAEELASGADSQARQASETASAMEEMANSVHTVFENSNKSLEAANKTNMLAEEGSEIIQKTMAGMSMIEGTVNESARKVAEVGARSTEIGKIVGVINEIAAQTNLLALNAAIEAARAGEHGRGFEVVASEIRKLAEQSANATIQITTIIEEIQNTTDIASESMGGVIEEVEKGAKLSDETGTSLQKITTSVRDTSELITDMNETSKQQASVSDQVAKSVENISAITKESASSTEEIARTTQELAKLADNIREQVAKFKV